MKRLIYILPFLLLPLLATQADTIAHEQGMPLFIVDGKVGVSKNDIPSPDEIASATFISYEEGVELYGKRATNGVLIVRTKNYEKEHVQEVQHAGKQQKSRDVKEGYLILALLVAFFLPKLILKAFSKLTKLYKENHRIPEKHYSPGPFSQNGVHFDAKEHPFFRLNILACIIVDAVLLWFVVTVWAKNDYSSPMLLFSIFIGVVALYFCVQMVAFISRKKCHFTIDKEGIHGNLYMDSPALKIPQFRKVNISWERVKCAEFFRAYQIWDADMLFLQRKKDSDFPLVCIPLGLFPTQKVLDAINYFCAAYYNQKSTQQTTGNVPANGKTDKNVEPEKPLIQPLKLEDNRLLKILMTIALLILLSPLYIAS